MLWLEAGTETVHAIGSVASRTLHAMILSERGILASGPFTCDVMGTGCLGRGQANLGQEQSSLQSIGSSITTK